MKRIGVYLLILILLGAAYGIYEYTRGVEGLADAKADYVMTADELYDAFESDEVKAQKLYVDKVIEVRGELIRIKETDSTASLTLKAKNAMVGGINCGFSEIKQKLSKGDSVIVKGRCQGFLMEVILNNCIIVGKE